MNEPYQTLPQQPIDWDNLAADPPRRIGRYRVERLLGKGGFGLVYLAQDEQLQRLVAVKTPHPNLVSRPEDAEAYLTEARTVAGLDHPNIVPVHDVGSAEKFPCYIVSKFIDGSTLAEQIRSNRPSAAVAVELTATVAETLQYAHKQGIVHRDIKPGNILLDLRGKPFVADFGLALREQDIGKGTRFAGTPAYMSPEQARGEGHRVDGRSDLFSLGVVFYELLTGRRPFKADAVAELLEQVVHGEVRPPRQWDDAIPKELERISLKALSKRASDRYTTGKDMAEDLRGFFEQSTEDEKASLRSRVATSGIPFPASAPTPLLNAPPTPASDQQPVKIVPKGLRSFDAQDADFFLELLPGPRDRDGLPDGIRFWKTRIEEHDPDNTFAVGLIYGPSGCGKSSLVKAGLLPRLSKDVIAVYVEATAEETEPRLLNGLRKRCPALFDALSLKETLAALRQGQGFPVGKKVLIVLDQFEQWLHAIKEERNTELVQALRHCDGGRVQCVVMVRDDFWMAATRFMRDLEIPLLESQNSAAVDLFPIRHAEKVLAAFGRAFGVLPEGAGELRKEQKQFLKQAASSLAQEGKVISVRLALFAEMMKGKAWTPTTLKEVGGAEGVGVAFLEETFSTAAAPPEHRYHQRAARDVLKSLLSESGMNIKGPMRSYAELLEASGYGSRPKDFDDLLRILDGEIRLITPTDIEGRKESSTFSLKTGEKYYQLTHDYLAPSLRDWLTRKQKETKRGRAELLLADQTSAWCARPQNQQLPSFWQWLRIHWLTRKENWTTPERKMMRKASGFHGVRSMTVAFLVILLALVGLEIRRRVEEEMAAGLVNRLLDAKIAQAPGVVAEIEPYRPWADPILREKNAEATDASAQKLYTSLALLPVDGRQVDYLYARLLDAEPQEVPVIRDSLKPHKGRLLEKLWKVMEQPAQPKNSQRLRAASALASYDPDSPRWTALVAQTVDDLVSVNPVFLGQWSENLQPIQKQLFHPLLDIFRGQRSADSKMAAANLLVVNCADQPMVLADLLMDADEMQFAVIYPKLKEQSEQALPLLTGEIAKGVASGLPSSDESRERLAKRQANAAIALLKMNQPAKVWPLLKHSPDPRVRSYLIHRFAAFGVDADSIVKRLMDGEPDVTIRRALVLSLGEFDPGSIADHQNLVAKLLQTYRDEADPGLHGAAEWLLRRLNQDEPLRQTTEELTENNAMREQRLERIKRSFTREGEKAEPQWYINGQGQTMVVMPKPVGAFAMGSPPTEKGRITAVEKNGFDSEFQHSEGIDRSFAVAAKPVTASEYRTFDNRFKVDLRYAREADCPVVGVSWYAAAAYCNWLSEKEGLKEQSCYETVEGRLQLKDNYLHLTGYRLPTEAEWEFACRAGAKTARFYGESEELLEDYGWFSWRSKPVGGKRPNDLGLFDMHGNVWNWCLDAFIQVPRDGREPITWDKEDVVNQRSNLRVMRGGSFLNLPLTARAAYRDRTPASAVYHSYGFRVARTFASD